MRRIFILPVIALASSVLLSAALAEESTSTSDSSYQLKSRSNFFAPDVSRPPFWPIGHVKRAVQVQGDLPAAPVPTMRLNPDMFSVTSILLGNPSLAVINGRAYGEGEYLRSAKGAASGTVARTPVDPRSRIRVLRIADGQVVLQSTDGQSIAVALRRSELGERKPDTEVELLLSEQQ